MAENQQPEPPGGDQKRLSAAESKPKDSKKRFRLPTETERLHMKAYYYLSIATVADSSQRSVEMGISILSHLRKEWMITDQLHMSVEDRIVMKMLSRDADNEMTLSQLNKRAYYQILFALSADPTPVSTHMITIMKHLMEGWNISRQTHLDCERKIGTEIQLRRTAQASHEKAETRHTALHPLGSESEYDSLQIIKNQDVEVLKELGSGTFGTVYHGKWRGADVAIKRIKKSCFAERSSEQERLTGEFWGEADILSKLHHPNVVAFYGVVKDGPEGTLATVTEYMVDCSLRHVLFHRNRHLGRPERLIIAMDAAFGMEYIHSKNIVHSNLKSENLLVNLKDPSRPICKVGDFGLSKIKRNTLVSGGVRGTLPWMAPELLNGSSSKVSEKADVFSFGIVLWEILTGEEPYANMDTETIIGGIVNNTLRPTIPASCDDEWRTLMEECWAPNPTARPSFTEIAGRLRVVSSAVTSSQSKPPTHRASR